MLAGCATSRETPAERVEASRELPTSAPAGEGAKEEARAVALRFLDAAEKGDFEKAHALLATPLRQRYTPQTFERDFRRDPLARIRLEQAREAVQRAPASQWGAGVLFSIDAERAFRLVEEEGGYRVAAIE